MNKRNVTRVVSLEEEEDDDDIEEKICILKPTMKRNADDATAVGRNIMTVGHQHSHQYHEKTSPSMSTNNTNTNTNITMLLKEFLPQDLTHDK